MAQNESTNTTIISRIMSKIDTAANWDANNPVLLKGEVVPVIVPDSEGNTAYVVFKVGDGVSNYATLPFTSANAWDVYDWAKAATKPTYDYSEIKNTPTIPSAPTIDQKYSATSKNAQSGVAVAEALALKVDKVDGKTLTSNDFTSALLSKLNGIAEGANKYVHPTHTAHSTSGLYKITVDALGHVTSATAVTKDDITKLGIPAITVDTAMSTTSTNPVQNKVVNTALSNKQDKFANVTNPGICKVTMSNSGQTYFCNGASDSGIYFDTSIRLLQGKGIKNDDDLVHKKYVDTEVANNKVTVDSEMSDTSTNPVQNKVVKAEIDSKALNVIDTGSGNLSISSLGYSPVTTNSVYISDFTDTDTASVNGSGDAVSTQSTGSDSVSTRATAAAGSNVTLKSIYFNDLGVTYKIPDAVTVDAALSSSSTNPVQNKVINTALAGKTDLSESGASSLINKLSTGNATPSDTDYFISQYVDGGTTNTNYYRRPISTLNTYIKSKADKTPTSGSANLVTSGAVYTALSGKTDLSESGASSLINKLSTGNATPSDTDYFISQYVDGGTTNTNYYRRPISTLNTYIKSKADKTPTSGSANLVTSGAVYTALSGKASSTHTHTLNQVTSSSFNTTGSVDYISRSLVPYISGTKFYGMPAAAITVEYSRDAGATWIDYGLDDGAKMRIFDHSGGANLYLGKASTKADNSINNMLRITIDATKSDGRYLSTDSMFTWMSSNGNTTCVTLEVASYSAPTTFKTIVNNAPINGWSGPNMSHYGSITFGGSTAGSTSPNNQFYRLTYKQTAISSSYSSALIDDIRFFGSALWGGGMAIVNGMLKYGAPYGVTIRPDTASGIVNFNLLGATFGRGTSADGKYSLAGGINAVANHEGSIAYGRDLNTSAQYQAVFGKYNKTNSSALFQIGNGTSESAKSNAFEVYNDGHAEVKAMGTTDNSVVIKSGLNTAIGDYLTTKYGSTYYASQGKEFYLPSGSNLVIPNATVGRLFMGPEGARSTDFKLYVSDPLDGGKLIITNLKTPTSDEDAANKKYVDDKIATQVSSVYKAKGSVTFSELPTTLTSSQEGYVYNISEEFTTTALFIEGAGKIFPSGTNVVVIKEGTAYKYDVLAGMVDLSGKQDKFATITTANTIQTVKIGDNLSIVTSPNFGYSQIRSSKILVLSGEDSTTSYVSLRKSKLESSCDFDATQGYLRVRDNPLADDFAVNKKYVTTAISNKLDADTDNYNIAYDTTSEAIKITFKN